MKIIKIILKLILIFVIGYLMFLPILRLNNYLFVKEVKAIQETINKERKVAFEVELTAITDTVIDINKDIEKFKVYYEFDILKPFFCKEFKNIKLVE